jgi:acetyl-CoA/propionyl-CoA carboxylase carboxyl transferase subunit
MAATTLATHADPREPRTRLSHLLDAGSLSWMNDPDDSGVRTARGTIDGRDVIAYCTDPSLKGGAIGAGGCGHIAAAIDLARTLRIPVIGLWHSGGARLAEGVRSMDGIGTMFRAMIRASGRIPQISVVLGPAAGGAAYGPALTDIVIMGPEARIFVTGPDVVRLVTGEDIDMAGLGGPRAHGEKSGVSHIVCGSEEEAFARARALTMLLAAQGAFAPETLRDDPDLESLLPESRRRAYDIRPIIGRIADPGTFQELQPRWAPNMVVGLGRLSGRTIGVIANNPLRKGGCLDSLSAEKAARFVRMCDSFGVPLAVIVDVPGYLPGVRQEWEGVVRRGAKLLYAFGEAVVPRVTVITRKSYGGAYIAMNSRALGADAVLAWPAAEVGVMGAEASVRILHRRALAAADEQSRDPLLADLVQEHLRTVGGVDLGVEIGVVDEIIEPSRTRRRIAETLAGLPSARGEHGNLPL